MSRGPRAGNDAPWHHDIRSHLASHSPSSTWSSAKERSLLEPYAYLASRPGKEIRSKLIDAFNFWLKVPEEHLSKVRKVVEMLHNASLLMDDVEDNSDLRRGMPVAHKVYGTPQVLNSANYVYFLVFREIEAMGQGEVHASSGSQSQQHPRLTSQSPAGTKATRSERLLIDEMINLHRGQGLDLLWRDTLQCPTEEEYVEMVRNKTGGLLRIAGGLMMIWSAAYAAKDAAGNTDSARSSEAQSKPTAPDLLPLLDLIGLLFQIRDDYMNLDSDAYALNKGFAEDLTEGKFSFPMIHGIRWSDLNSTASSTSSEHISQAQSDAFSVRSAAAMGLPQTSFPRTALDSPISVQATQHLSATSATGPLTESSIVPNRQLLSILSSRTTDEHLKRYAISYLRNVSGSFRYCRHVMRRLDEAIWKELEDVERAFGTLQGPDTAQVSQKNELLRIILLALRKGWWEEQDDETTAT